MGRVWARSCGVDLVAEYDERVYVGGEDVYIGVYEVEVGVGGNYSKASGLLPVPAQLAKIL